MSIFGTIMSKLGLGKKKKHQQFKKLQSLRKQRQQ